MSSASTTTRSRRKRTVRSPQQERSTPRSFARRFPGRCWSPENRRISTRAPWLFTDRLVGDAAAAGIRVIMTADSTPCWASSAPKSLLQRCKPLRASTANGWPPRAPADYAAFVAFLAKRYGTQLAAIEVWNEPDQSNEAYFAGPNKPTRYAAILRTAYPAIKAAGPNVSVLAGALVGSNGVFLRDLYAAGIKGYYDGLAVHYYNLTLASLRAIHEVQLANGDTTPLWLDEFGWSSCWPRQRVQQEQACVTAPTQAANLANIFPRAGAHLLHSRRSRLQAAELNERRLRSPVSGRGPQARVRHVCPRSGSPFGNPQPGHPEPQASQRPGRRERLRARWGLHGA